MAKRTPRPNPQKPDQQTIREMLDDVEAVTKSRFYEDPNPVASPVEMFRMPEGKPGGETFAELSGREKWQVLGDYTPWHDYEQRGVSFEQMDQVFSNVIDDKPREQWLDGTGLAGPDAVPDLGDALPTPQAMRELFAEWREDYRAAAEGHRLPAGRPQSMREVLQRAAGGELPQEEPAPPVAYFAPETRARLIREAFDAFAAVGFLKWKREEIERHGTAPEVVEAERGSYVTGLERTAWPEFREMAAKATDGRLLDIRQDWIERAKCMGLLDRQGKLTVQHVHDELRRYTGGTYPKAEQPPKQKGRGFEPER